MSLIAKVLDFIKSGGVPRVAADSLSCATEL